MKILVAGGTGAIGRPLIAELLAKGHDVVALTRSPEGAQALVERGVQPAIADVPDDGVPLFDLVPDGAVRLPVVRPLAAAGGLIRVRPRSARSGHDRDSQTDKIDTRTVPLHRRVNEAIPRAMP